jgi:hypothetical protein
MNKDEILAALHTLKTHEEEILALNEDEDDEEKGEAL